MVLDMVVYTSALLFSQLLYYLCIYLRVAIEQQKVFMIELIETFNVVHVPNVVKSVSFQSKQARYVVHQRQSLQQSIHDETMEYPSIHTTPHFLQYIDSKKLETKMSVDVTETNCMIWCSTLRPNIVLMTLAN